MVLRRHSRHVPRLDVLQGRLTRKWESLKLFTEIVRLFINAATDALAYAVQGASFETQRSHSLCARHSHCGENIKDTKSLMRTAWQKLNSRRSDININQRKQGLRKRAGKGPFAGMLARMGG